MPDSRKQLGEDGKKKAKNYFIIHSFSYYNNLSFLSHTHTLLFMYILG